MPAKKYTQPTDHARAIVTSPISALESQAARYAAIDRALRPLRLTVHNPPTAADVRAVGQTLDALLAKGTSC